MWLAKTSRDTNEQTVRSGFMFDRFVSTCAQQVFVAECILVTPMSFLYGTRFVGPFTPLVFSLRQVHSFFNFS